jgi:hypothetical protein
VIKDEVPPAPPAPAVDAAPPAAPPRVSVAAPPVPPAPPAPIDSMILEADEITFSDGLIKLRGSVQTKEAGREIVGITATSLNWESGMVVRIDGKEPEKGKTYSGRYEVRRLSGDESVRKYGDKARNGAVELKRVAE